MASQTITLTVTGWTSNNGSLVELIFAVDPVFRLNIANGQQGVLMSTVLNSRVYNFAQKDDSNSFFQVDITSLTSSNGTSNLDFSLWQRGYNNIANNSCDSTCPSGKGV